MTPDNYTPIINKIAYVCLTVLEALLFTVTLHDGIDLITKGSAATATVVIAYFTYRKLKKDMILTDIKTKREIMEMEIQEKKLENYFKEKHNIK